jgi:hypothetical protein
MEKYDEETIKWLEERSNKLMELESMIRQLQYNANDKEEDRLDKDDMKMEIFKLWYFQNFNKKWGEE